MMFWLWQSKWNPWNTAKMVLTSCETYPAASTAEVGGGYNVRSEWKLYIIVQKLLKLPTVGLRSLFFKRKLRCRMKHSLYKKTICCSVWIMCLKGILHWNEPDVTVHIIFRNEHIMMDSGEDQNFFCAFTFR